MNSLNDKDNENKEVDVPVVEHLDDNKQNINKEEEVEISKPKMDRKTFQDQRKKELKKSHPHLSIKDVSTMINQEWNKMNM